MELLNIKKNGLDSVESVICNLERELRKIKDSLSGNDAYHAQLIHTRLLSYVESNCRLGRKKIYDVYKYLRGKYSKFRKNKKISEFSKFETLISGSLNRLIYQYNQAKDE